MDALLVKFIANTACSHTATWPNLWSLQCHTCWLPFLIAGRVSAFLDTLVHCCLVWHAVLLPLSPQCSKQYAGCGRLQEQRRLLEGQLARAQQAAAQLAAQFAKSKDSKQAELDAMHAEMRSRAAKFQSAEVSPAYESANLFATCHHWAEGIMVLLAVCPVCHGAACTTAAHSATAVLLDLLQQIQLVVQSCRYMCSTACRVQW